MKQMQFGFRQISLVLIAALAGCGNVQAETPQTFTEKMMQQFQDASPSVKFSIKEDLVLSRKGGEWEEGEINLHRIFYFCQNNPAKDCDDLKSEFVKNLASASPSTFGPSDLRVIVRDEEYMDYLRGVFSKGDSEAGSLISEKIGDDLYAILAFDSTNAIQLATTKHIKEFSYTSDAAWQAGLKQTRAILPEFPSQKQLLNSAVAFEDQEYLASMLTFRDEWREISDAVGKDLFVTAVSDQFLFVGKMPDGAKLDDFKKTVREDCDAQPRCISPNIYRFANGSWTLAR